METEFKILDATETWFSTIQKLPDNEEVYIFSPYITGSVIEDLLTKSDSKNLRVITKLDISSYVSGSLDLDVLRNLINSGVKVFHHSSLHAKILLTRRVVVSGSQNFTRGGRKNLEAFSKINLSVKESQKIRKKATDIISDATLLSKNMIDNFQETCDPLIKDFKKYNKKLHVLEKMIEKGGFLDDPSKVLNNDIGKFQKFFDLKENSVVVRLVEKQTDYQDYWTLKRYYDFQVLNSFSSGKIKLKPRHKYLCLDAITHSTFVIRANKTQIGQIYNDGLVFMSNPKYPGYSYAVSRISCLTPSDNIYLANLRLSFDPYPLHIISNTAKKILKEVQSVYVYFNGFDLKLRGIKQYGHSEGQEKKEFFKGEKRFSEIENFLKPKLKSFIFEKPWVSSKGYSSPERFFDASNTIELNASVYRGQYFYTIYQKKH